MLGICVGMQILFARGIEHGVETEGLRRVARHGRAAASAADRPAHGLEHGRGPRGLPALRRPRRRRPATTSCTPTPCTTGSWRSTNASDPRPQVTWAAHGEPFVAAVENGPLWATQFHPEKSGDAGAQLLTNWTRAPSTDAVDREPDQARTPPRRRRPRRPGRPPRARRVRLRDLLRRPAGRPPSPGSSAGAEWLHLVDLDAAFGTGDNRALIAEVARAMDIKVELSGGIRDDDSLAAALATGCRRVNLGTAALETPEWVAKVIAEHGDKIAVGLDVRGTTLRGRGWTRDGGDLYETLDRLDAEGCARYVVTDITKDGTLQGPNLELLRDVCAATDRPVVASGGVSSLDDLRALADSGTGGRRRRHRGQGPLRQGVHPGRGFGGGRPHDRTP